MSRRFHPGGGFPFPGTNQHAFWGKHGGIHLHQPFHEPVNQSKQNLTIYVTQSKRMIRANSEKLKNACEKIKNG
jgi:hypothetical protein